MYWETILTELDFKTSRSSGAGGQHVNKTETKVEVRFDVGASMGLSNEEKQIILEKLATSVSDTGILSVSSQQSRSQFSNKENAINKLQGKLEKALKPVSKRLKTKPSKASIEERLQEKKLQAEKKESRKKPRL